MRSQDCGGAAGSTPRLPPGAVKDLGTFDADTSGQQKAVTYWKQRFADLGDGALTTIGSAGFADATLAAATKKLDDNRGRSTLDTTISRVIADIDRLPRQRGTAQFTALLHDRAAMLTTSDAATASEITGGHQGLMRAVANLASAKKGEQHRAFRGARELADLLNRWAISGDIASALGCNRSTVLAYWRQESALCVSPVEQSWPHAPLVATRTGAARVPCVSVAANVRRDGFLLSEFRGARGGLNPEFDSVRLLLLGNTAYGLDQVNLPLLDERDELWTLITTAAARGAMADSGWSSPFDIATVATLLTADRRAGRQTGPARTFFQLFAGIVSLRAESGRREPLPAPLRSVGAPADGMPAMTSEPTEEVKLLTKAREHFYALHAAYPGVTANNTLFVKPNDQTRDTRTTLCTAVELMWRRRTMRSFLAVADRYGMEAAPVLSPRMMYLRFHATDALFGTYLIRVGSALSWLSEKGQLDPSSPFATAVRNVTLLKSFVAKMTAIRDGEWAQVGVHRVDVNPARWHETVWRHIGLLDDLRRSQLMPSEWLPKPPPAPRELANAAQGARKLTQALIDHPGALDAIEAFLFGSEISRIAKLHAKRPSLLPSSDSVIALNPIIKAHNFELLRTTFSEAGFDAA